MCTSIVEIVDAEGKGKDGNAWFKLSQAVVCYDHPHHALLDEAITIDFMNNSDGPGTRAAVELTLESAKALQGALARAIEQADEELAEMSA
tara:strand:- start:110 stop:382 length:273 start_codon:yes stop_codon:yes gene_type:complete